MFGMVNTALFWSASGVILIALGGLYTAVRQYVGGKMDTLQKSVDAIGTHLERQDRLIDDTRQRVARIEGAMNLPPAKLSSQDP